MMSSRARRAFVWYLCSAVVKEGGRRRQEEEGGNPEPCATWLAGALMAGGGCPRQKLNPKAANGGLSSAGSAKPQPGSVG